MDLQGDEVDIPIHRSKIKLNFHDGGSTRRVKVRMTIGEHGDIGNIITNVCIMLDVDMKSVVNSISQIPALTPTT